MIGSIQSPLGLDRFDLLWRYLDLAFTEEQEYWVTGHEAHDCKRDDADEKDDDCALNESDCNVT